MINNLSIRYTCEQSGKGTINFIYNYSIDNLEILSFYPKYNFVDEITGKV